MPPTPCHVLWYVRPVLSEPARKRLNQLVYRFLGVDPAIVAIDGLLGDGESEHLPFSKPFQIARWVVDRVLRDDSPRRFCRLVGLVDAGESVPELHALMQALRHGKDEWVQRQRDPLVVLDGSPFVDREAVRDVIAAMFTPAMTTGCLLVSGGKGEGKTYLRQLCAKLVEPSTSRLATFEVDDARASALDPGIVAFKLRGPSTGKRPSPSARLD